ncbi:MAG: SIS domain-containing protein [Longicatena sp.]
MTLLDCIYRVPTVIETIIENRKKIVKPIIEYLGNEINEINEIVLVGSGTSNTCSLTSHEFVEEASGLLTSVILPNPFLNKSVYNSNALYIFTSQSGTSTLTQEALSKIKDLGYFNCSITENTDSSLAIASDVHVKMETDHEEFGQRTIGYCSSAFTQMMIAMEIGLVRATLTESKYDEYLNQAKAACKHHHEIYDKTMIWFDTNKWNLMNKDGFVFYGVGDLYGVAQEGALKSLEVAKRFLCVGYEMDDGMHGPTMGFTNRHGIIILNDGRNQNIANGLAKYIKAEVSDAFVIGKNTIDEKDLAFEPIGGPFKYIEYAPVVEVLAYRLAVDYGIKVKEWKEQDPLPEGKYFNTHDE